MNDDETKKLIAAEAAKAMIPFKVTHAAEAIKKAEAQLKIAKQLLGDIMAEVAKL